MVVRQITPADYAQCCALYNYYIENTVVTFEYDPLSDEAFAARADGISSRFPYLVCETEDGIAGFAYLDLFGERKGFHYTLDVSIYVREDIRHCGIGSALIEELVRQGDAAGYRDLIAVITGENSASIAFHAAHGFKKAAEIKGIGDKFGKRLDLVYMQRTLR